MLGDRNSDADLAALRDGQWDATVDVNAYLPRQVRALAGVLDGRGGHQLFISTVSVYRTPVAPGFREDAPVHELPEPFAEELTPETYGGLKVACERAVMALHGADSTVIRPTYPRVPAGDRRHDAGRSRPGARARGRAAGRLGEPQAVKVVNPACDHPGR